MDQRDRMLNLHGINRRTSVANTAVLTQEDETSKTMNRISRDLKRVIATNNVSKKGSISGPVVAPRSRSGSIIQNMHPEADVEKGDMPRAQSSHRRRHSVAAARKNGSWADVFVSVAASEIAMAAFVTFKEAKDIDAEYFYNLVPKAVVLQDVVYKELLAVYNAVKYWGPKIFLGRKIYFSMTNDEALALLMKAKVNARKVTPQKLLILREINEICHRQCIEFRASLNDDANETLVFYLANSHVPQMKRKFDVGLNALENDQNIANKKHHEFIAVEKLFPPSYV